MSSHHLALEIRRLPVEIRAMIYVFLDSFVLAKHCPEVFRALCPRYFLDLTIGKGWGFPTRNIHLKTNLVKIYPDSGNWVETLTIAIHEQTNPIISDFLKNFPTERKLKRVNIVSSNAFREAPCDVKGLTRYLKRVLEMSPSIKRLSFYDFQPELT